MEQFRQLGDQVWLYSGVVAAAATTVAQVLFFGFLGVLLASVIAGMARRHRARVPGNHDTDASRVR